MWAVFVVINQPLISGRLKEAQQAQEQETRNIETYQRLMRELVTMPPGTRMREDIERKLRDLAHDSAAVAQLERERRDYLINLQQQFQQANQSRAAPAARQRMRG